MGYRSDVNIMAYAPEPVMTAFMAAQRIAGEKWLDDEFSTIKYIDTPTGTPHLMVHFVCEGVKWYEGYDDVASWVRMTSAIEEREDISLEYQRIGEECEDMVESYHGEDCRMYSYISRSIDYSLPKNTI